MSSRYTSDIDLSLSNNTHATLVRFVGENKRVLELGAASGYMTRVLKERGCKVTAVEFDPDVIEELGAIADEAVLGDLNDPSVLDEISGTFDTVLAGDVLEHLLDPLKVLRAATAKLGRAGSVVISVPNVGHADLRLSLLQGRFDYRETGLLDDTHIRFFTYETFLDMLNQAGLLVLQIDRTTAKVFETELAVPRESVSEEVLEEVMRIPESETYQFIVEAVPDDGSPELRRRSHSILDEARRSELARSRTRSKRASPRVAAALEKTQAHLAVAEADRDRARQRVSDLGAELASARLEIAGFESELEETRRQLFAACIGEAERNALKAELDEIRNELTKWRNSSTAPQDLSRLVVELRHQAAASEKLDQILASRSYRLIRKYRRLVDRVAPAGSRRRALYRGLAGHRRRR